jgi:hypothetical protein
MALAERRRAGRDTCSFLDGIAHRTSRRAGRAAAAAAAAVDGAAIAC